MLRNQTLQILPNTFFLSSFNQEDVSKRKFGLATPSRFTKILITTRRRYHYVCFMGSRVHDPRPTGHHRLSRQAS